MNNNCDFDEWELIDKQMGQEDQLNDFYNQLRIWTQKNVEVKKLRAEVEAEIRLLRNYASMNGIDMTNLIFPEGKFEWQERRCPITRELLLKHCDGLVSEDILQQLFDRIRSKEIKQYQVFRQRRETTPFDGEE